MLWYRLRNDFPLAIITLIAMCAVFGITPFAIYRFAKGQLVAGVIDMAMVLIIVGAVVHAWRSGNTRTAAWICSVSATSGCTAIAILMGLPGFPLTGAYNRRAMETELEVAVELQRRERRVYGLAVIDLDHFKRINDRHGHAAGDQVLIDFVRLVRAGTRKIDRLFRYGGEEFVLLLPGADAAALHTILENLRMRIGQALQSRGEVITVSVGAAALQPDEHWEAWLARADAALYQAKEQGRNRSVVADAAAVQDFAQAPHTATEPAGFRDEGRSG
ncbi:MAG: GGDEF domain-containing protein [Gammaproteobacteria bacterium]|nr:GGDEF domain-containing protein [Gammaproteobacteria bacterium]